MAFTQILNRKVGCTLSAYFCLAKESLLLKLPQKMTYELKLELHLNIIAYFMPRNGQTKCTVLTAPTRKPALINSQNSRSLEWSVYLSHDFEHHVT